MNRAPFERTNTGTPLIFAMSASAVLWHFMSIGSAQDSHEETVETLLGTSRGQAVQNQSESMPSGSPAVRMRGIIERAPEVESRTVQFGNTRGIPKAIIVAEEAGLVEVEKDEESGVSTVRISVDESSKVTRRSIHFKVASTQFADPQTVKEIAKLAQVFKDERLKEEYFVIEGHSSAEGGELFNLDLSQDRADAIVADLIRLGVPREQLVPVGFGESKAAFSASASETDRAKDRRVEIYRLSD